MVEFCAVVPSLCACCSLFVWMIWIGMHKCILDRVLIKATVVYSFPYFVK